MPELIKVRDRINKDIFSLQRVVLPHHHLIMLLNRTQELQSCLNQSLETVCGAGVSSTPVRAASAHSTVLELYVLLEKLRLNVANDLKTVEQQVNFKLFTQQLKELKTETRTLSGKLSRAMGQKDSESVLAELGCQWQAYDTSLQQMQVALMNTLGWIEPKIQAGFKVLNQVFSVMAKHPHLAEIQSNTLILLKQLAFKSLANSDLVNKYFDFSQLRPDAAKFYEKFEEFFELLEEQESVILFNSQYYLEKYPEVRQLRYYPLEHYVRYGEMMHYRPGPQFDAIYYLQNNEDITDAYIPPLRHFLHHGYFEGRPPSSESGLFFITNLLDLCSVKVTFVGVPDSSSEDGWKQLKSGCAQRPQGRVVHVSSEDWTGKVVDCDAIILGAEGIDRLKCDLLQEVAESGCKVVYLGDNPQEDLAGLLQQDILPLTRLCAITTNYELFMRWQESSAPVALQYYPFSTPKKDAPFVEALLNRLADGKDFELRKIAQWGVVDDTQPGISVVSIIYKKFKEMQAFIESLNRQDIGRSFEVVLVDDSSPDDCVERVEAWLNEQRDKGLLNKHMTVRILRNEINSGNCVSRNRGIQAAKADIVLVADGDVVFNASNLSEHLWAYRYGDCDAVIGFFYFNMNYHDVFQWIAACEINRDVVRKKIAFDHYFSICPAPNSIYNFVTRNVSFTKSALNFEYFDESFTYSSHVDSGYGEEDHEMGARLYFTGKNVRFLDSSACVHISHRDNSYNSNKNLANLRNWNRLIAKYPDLFLVDRSYYQSRTRNLLAKFIGKPDAPEVVEAKQHYLNPQRPRVNIPLLEAPLNILTFPSNNTYLYNLFKMRHRFTIASGLTKSDTNGWDYSLRPRPYNLSYSDIGNIEAGKYDFAIIPIEEELLYMGEDEDSHVIWAKKLIEMLELTKGMRRIAVCHTPLFNTFPDTTEIDNKLNARVQKRRAIVRSMLQNIHVVCSSHQLKTTWNFAQSSVIWQGFSPEEYPAGTHENGCVTLVNPDLPGKIGDDLRLMQKKLSDVCLLKYCQAPSVHPGYMQRTQEWAVARLQSYVKYLGSFSVCLTTQYSLGIPQVISEAMLTGVIPVVFRSPDAEMFIQHGKNGFIGDSVEELTEHILWLFQNERQCRTIHRQARLTAMDIFNVDRALTSWINLFRHTV